MKKCYILKGGIIGAIIYAIASNVNLGIISQILFLPVFFIPGFFRFIDNNPSTSETFASLVYILFGFLVGSIIGFIWGIIKKKDPTC